MPSADDMEDEIKRRHLEKQREHGYEQQIEDAQNRVVDLAMRRVREATDALHAATMSSDHEVLTGNSKATQILAKLYPGEPFFVFRAKDILSTFALDEYAKFVEKFNPDSPMLVSLVDAINDFRAWQTNNPDKVKLPD